VSVFCDNSILSVYYRTVSCDLGCFVNKSGRKTSDVIDFIGCVIEYAGVDLRHEFRPFKLGVAKEPDTVSVIKDVRDFWMIFANMFKGGNNSFWRLHFVLSANRTSRQIQYDCLI
jgi:hypothetical protein